EVGRAGGHHLDGAARQAERGGHHAVALRPLHQRLEVAGEEVVVEPLQAHCYAASSSGPTRRTVESDVRSEAMVMSGRRRLAGPQSSAPRLIRYTNDTNTKMANTSISMSPNRCR